MDKSESTALLTLRLASGLSLFTVVLAIVLGWRGDQLPAAIFLAFAIISSIFAGIAYRRYSEFRSNRWKQELSEGDEQLKRVLERTDEEQLATRDE